MSAVFLKILNMSITASWLILVIIPARLILKKAPKWIPCLLWGLVAIFMGLAAAVIDQLLNLGGTTLEDA